MVFAGLTMIMIGLWNALFDWIYGLFEKKPKPETGWQQSTDTYRMTGGGSYIVTVPAGFTLTLNSYDNVTLGSTKIEH